MRHLVYRVEPLPQSMIPLVWDFGQLDSTVERLYILQMLNRYVSLILVSMDLQTIENVIIPPANEVQGGI